MPYVLDLVRLVASIQLASDDHRAISDQTAAAAAAAAVTAPDSKNPQAAASRSKARPGCRDYAEPAKGKPEKFWKEVERISTRASRRTRLPVR